MASNIDVSVPTPVRATTKSVRDNFVAAKDEIEALQASESQLVADVEAEKIRNDDQDQRLDALEAGGGGSGNIDLTPLEDDITALDARVTVNEDDIATNVTDIADLNARVTVNEGDIATNVTDIADIKADTDRNTADIAAHEIRIDDLEARPIGTGGGGGVPEPDAVKDPDLADVALVRETTVISNPQHDPLDPDSKEFLNSGKWRTIKTGDIETDPAATFTFDPNNPEYAGLDTQLKVNRFLAEKVENINQPPTGPAVTGTYHRTTQGAASWKEGDVFGQTGSSSDMDSMTHYTFSLHNLEGDFAGWEDARPGTQIKMSLNDVDTLTATIESLDFDAHGNLPNDKFVDVYFESGSIVTTGNHLWYNWTTPISVEVERADPRDLEQEVDDLRVDVDKNTSDIGDLRTDVDENTSDIGDLRTDVDNKYDKTGGLIDGDASVEGDFTVNSPYVLKANNVASIGNSNLSIKRNTDTKLLLSSSDTLSYQPLKYNANYNLNDDLHLITKGYVDDAVADVSVEGFDELVDQVEENTGNIQELIDAAGEAADMFSDSLVKTDAELDIPMSRSFYDKDNHRIISLKTYFSGYTRPQDFHLAVTDPDTGDTTYLGVKNPTNDSRYESLGPCFKMGDDYIFSTVESPKDHPFLKLTPSNTFEPYGDPDLKICKSWAYINYTVPLDDTGRFRLLVGNPIDRLDPNGGNGSRQAQVTLLLDTQDLVNQTPVEDYTDNNTGVTYQTLTKTLSSNRGGIPKVVNGEVYTFQPDKNIQKIDIRDFESKDVRLIVANSTKLPYDHLLDGDGKRIAEKGRLNGLTEVHDRYVVWHALNVGIMCYDTVEDTVENIYPTDNWIEYGVNYAKKDIHVPQIHDTLWFAPHAYTGHDGVDVPLEIIKVSTEDFSISTLAMPDNRKFGCNSSSKIGLNKIVMTNWTDEVTFYDVVNNKFSTVNIGERAGPRFVFNDNDYFSARAEVVNNSIEPGAFTKHAKGLDQELVENTNFLDNALIKEHDDFIQEDRAKISGDEFEGPIFGPTITNLFENKGEFILKTSSGNIHDDPDTVTDGECLVNSKTVGSEIDDGVMNRLKVRLYEDVSNYTDRPRAIYALVQPTTGAVQIWQCSNSGFGGGGSNYILNVVAEETEGDWFTENEPVILYSTGLTVSPYLTLEMLKQSMDKLGGSNIPGIANNTNRIEGVKDDLDAVEEDLASTFNPRMRLMRPDKYSGTKDWNKEMFEHSMGLFPEKDDLYYHNVEQRFFLHIRMYEGGKDKTDISTPDLKNDLLPSFMLYDTKTGKSQRISEGGIDKWANGSQAPTVSTNYRTGENTTGRAHMPLRGGMVLGRKDGSCDFYAWVSHPDKFLPQNDFNGRSIPLYRIHIPADIDDSQPFKSILCKWTNIHKTDLGSAEYPAENPYTENNSDNLNINQQYPHEISSVSWSLRDMKDPRGQRKYWFMMSHNKQSKDFVTFSTYHIKFDGDTHGDPDEGSIVWLKSPVELGEKDKFNSHKYGRFASGYPIKKMDVDGNERCFLFASPIGLSEIYFRTTDAGDEREPIIRNYPDYIPNGPKVVDPDGKVNDLGHPRIISKGIYDNWFKNDQSNIQFLNFTPLDDNDRTSCLAIWFQGSYGICSLNLQHLGTIDRSSEVRLENNFKGDLNSLSIHHTGNQNYRGYLEQGSVKNLMRFSRVPHHTHASGSVWFFDYKDGYVNENNEYWNTSREYDANGNKTDFFKYKRGIIEVQQTPDGDLEIIGHQTGSIHNSTGVEYDPAGLAGNSMHVSGEALLRVKNKFILGSAVGSHSTIAEPLVYMFDPRSKSFSQIKPYPEWEGRDISSEINVICFVDFPHKEAILSTNFGKNRLNSDGSDNGEGTPLIMFEYGSQDTISGTRQQANLVRVLNDIAGYSIDGIGDTWALDSEDDDSDLDFVDVIVDYGDDFESIDDE